MSDTFKKVSMIGAIVISGMACIGFWAALVIAYLSKDQTNLAMLLGIVAGGFTGTLNYWLGSSSGSQKKDDIIASSVPATAIGNRFTNDELDKLADLFMAKTSPSSTTILAPSPPTTVASKPVANTGSSATQSMPDLPPV